MLIISKLKHNFCFTLCQRIGSMIYGKEFFMTNDTERLIDGITNSQASYLLKILNNSK